jgi:hypothetical protein
MLVLSVWNIVGVFVFKSSMISNILNTDVWLSGARNMLEYLN